jgi:16S rRNA (guanine966-N2)-methyltransferase
LIEFPDADDLRPTPDRVRETLFNWLGQDLSGRRCLDLFAGSGALGMEAASRGASEVVMVEKDRTVFRKLQENVAKLKFDNIVLRNEDGLNFASRANEQFDVIFLDPPFKSKYIDKLLIIFNNKLDPGGVLYVESGTAFEPGATWQVYKQGKAGAIHYHY